MEAITKKTKALEAAGIALVDEVEAARMMGRAVQTMRNDRFMGRGCPYIRVGQRSIRYMVSDIEAYLLKNRIDPEG